MTMEMKELEKEAEEYWDTLGPGLTTGAADDDPSVPYWCREGESNPHEVALGGF